MNKKNLRIISRLIGFALIAAAVFAGLPPLWSVILVVAGIGQMVIFGGFG